MILCSYLYIRKEEEALEVFKDFAALAAINEIDNAMILPMKFFLKPFSNLCKFNDTISPETESIVSMTTLICLLMMIFFIMLDFWYRTPYDYLKENCKYGGAMTLIIVIEVIFSGIAFAVVMIINECVKKNNPDLHQNFGGFL